MESVLNFLAELEECPHFPMEYKQIYTLWALVHSLPFRLQAWWCSYPHVFLGSREAQAWDGIACSRDPLRGIGRWWSRVFSNRCCIWSISYGIFCHLLEITGFKEKLGDQLLNWPAGKPSASYTAFSHRGHFSCSTTPDIVTNFE